LAAAHHCLDPVLPLARKMALQELVPALAVAAALCAADGDARQALRFVEEYERALSPAAPASWYWGGWYLADIVRVCAALGELERAQRLVGAAEPALWRHQLEMRSAKAAIAEAAGDPGADLLYTEAASGWQAYGHQLERGLALLGLGRCRLRAGHSGASESLLAARIVFAELGAAMPLTEADRWLGNHMRRTS
jgi:hypothetical protein